VKREREGLQRKRESERIDRERESVREEMKGLLADSIEGARLESERHGGKNRLFY
jgi:hypothetical protein